MSERSPLSTTNIVLIFLLAIMVCAQGFTIDSLNRRVKALEDGRPTLRLWDDVCHVATYDRIQ